MVSNSSKTASGGKEYWLKNSWLPNSWLWVSAISESQDAPWQDPEPEESDKLIAILKERRRSTQCTLISAVVDKPDFLPLSFLQTGTKRSLAVCRIVRNFPHQDFLDIVKKIQNLKDITNFDSVEKLNEIFSIPNQVADEIFCHVCHELTPLDALNKLTKAQLAKLNPIPIGTGFLVGGTHLLTNQHVLPTQEVAEQCIAQFNYVDEVIGSQPVDYEFDPKVLFVSNPDLDYTLVQLKAGMFTMPAGYNFGWIQLIEDEENIICELDEIQIESLKDDANLTKKQRKSYGLTEKVTLPGDAVIIIQHPKGRRKQITLTNNIVKGLYKNFLRYTADSDYGSSGSPVFNNKWELVALHHAAIAEVPEKNEQENKQDNSKVKVVAQQGVRICRIVENLKKKSFSDPKLASFIEDFVITSEQLNYPAFPSVLEFDGVGSYVDFNDESLKIRKKITFEAWIECKDVTQNGIIVKVGAYSLSYEAQKLRVTKMLQSSTIIKSIDICVSTKDPVLNDGLWHHVAFTEDDITLEEDEIKSLEKIAEKTEKKIKEKNQIYIDGKLLNNDQITCSSNFASNSDLIKLSIGGISTSNNYWGGNTQRSFSGSITQVRLWEAVRTCEQIKENMYRISLKNKEKAEDLTPPFQVGLQFNGRNDYIDCGKYESLKIEDAITVEAWVKENDNNNGIIVNRGGSWHEKGFCVWKCDGNIRAELSDGETQALVDAKLDSKITASWYHVAFTWNIESKRIKIYINGKEPLELKQQIIIRKQGEFLSQEDALFEKFIGQPIVNLNIGRAQRVKNDPMIQDKYEYYFNGCIAEVRLWKVARKEKEIKANMSVRLDVENAKDEKLIGYWRLDEEESDKAKNFASDGEDGVVYGGKWLKLYHLLVNNQSVYGLAFGTKTLKASQYPALPLPFGLQFQGKGDHIDCGNDESLNITGNDKDEITVEAWVKHKFGNGLIVGRGGQEENGYSLSWYEGKIRVALRGKTSVALLGKSPSEKLDIDTKTIIDTKDNAPTDGVWHHIAFTWEKKSQEVAIYIDGRLQDIVMIKGRFKSIVFQGQYKSIALFTGSIRSITAHLIIGDRKENKSSGDTEEDKSSGDTEEDKSSGDTEEDKSSGDTEEDKSSGDTEEDKSYFNVVIADVRLWKVARTQDEIKANMSLRLKGNEEGLKGYWRLDDGGEGNTQVRNLASDNNHGTVTGAKWFPAPPSTAQDSPK